MSTPPNGDAGGRAASGDTTAKSAQSTLSVDRAFVVQFREAPRDAWQGRVEHIASGRSVTFASSAELLAFLSPAAPPDGVSSDDEPLTD
jgi:hypothetical protein